MKSYLWLAFALAAAMSAGGFYQAGVLKDGHNELRVVREKARQLGIDDAESVHSRSRPRVDRGSKPSLSAGRALAPDVIRLFDPGQLDILGRVNLRAAVQDLMMEIEGLSLQQVRSLIDEVRMSKNLDRSAFSKFAALLLNTFTQSRPGDAFELSFDFEPLEENLNEGERLMENLRPRAFERWAEDDAMGALDWARAAMVAYPERVTGDAKNQILRHVAALDRKLAFNLVQELKMADPEHAVGMIVWAPKTAEERLAAIADLRGHLATVDDAELRDGMRSEALANLGIKAAGEGFEKAVALAEAARFDFTETAQFTWNVAGSAKQGEEGAWAGWLSGQVAPDGRLPKSLQFLITRWTDRDYKAVAEWLNSRPPGVAKNMAIVAFVEKLAWYEPEAAAGWAATLPVGEQRDVTVRKVYDAWIQEKPDAKAAADAFAEKNGVMR